MEGLEHYPPFLPSLALLVCFQAYHDLSLHAEIVEFTEEANRIFRQTEAPLGRLT